MRHDGLNSKRYSELKILLIGKVSVFYGLEASYLRAFQKLGAKVFVFDPIMEIPQLIKDDTFKDHIIARTRRFIITRLQHIWADPLLRRYAKVTKFNGVDLVLIFKCPWLKSETLLDLKESTRALFFHFNADSPFDKAKANYHPNLIETIPLYDCYFIWHKGLISEIYKVGAKKVEYLPFAWDPELHKSVAFTQEDISALGSNISFVGNWTLGRERWLSYVADMDLRIWGTCFWERAKEKAVKGKWIRHAPLGEEFVKVVRASKINLNFLRDQNKGSHNMRTFEVPGCGGFLLTERSEEQLEFFEEDKEIACFSTPEELRDKIKFYLSRDELRRKMAERAHRKVAQGHTYLDRAKRILEVYEEVR
jgi:hypothetical protein